MLALSTTQLTRRGTPYIIKSIRFEVPAPYREILHDNLPVGSLTESSC